MIRDISSRDPGRNTLGSPELEHASPVPASRRDEAGFVTLMRNDARISTRASPAIAFAPAGLGLIRVELRSALMIVSEIGATRRDAASDVIDLVTGTRVALRTVALEGASVFSFLSDLPAGLSIDRFIPAFGALMLYDNDGRRRALRGSGFDIGASAGWIIDALEG